MSCEKCGSKTHRDDAMNVRCNSCEHLMRQCICVERSLIAMEIKCNPPWVHTDNCKCEESMAEEAEDWRDTMQDKWETPNRSTIKDFTNTFNTDTCL